MPRSIDDYSNGRVGLFVVTPDAEKLVLRIARVSSDQENTNVGLIKYLIRHEHWSPFEMVHMVLEITTSRAISAQLIRHRSFAFQEFSQRYAIPEDSLIYGARRQADKNRQSSIDDLDVETKDWFLKAQERSFRYTKGFYDKALEKGIARESARFLLPMSTITKLYMAGSVRSWIHYLQLRCAEDTQNEHRSLALQAKEIFCSNFPVTSEALGWNDEIPAPSL